ncbi:MAG: VTT domain-containing protein [Pseudomonadota bacterium]|nr:VTT domain-containing protein [Pseudomonadota bacterium]
MESFITTYGAWAVTAGAMLQEEMVLILGGFFAHRQYLQLFPDILLFALLANFLANHVNYAIGARYGEKLFQWLKIPEKTKEGIRKKIAHHPLQAVLGVRFAPGLHTLGPILFGLSGFSTSKWLAYNLLASSLWVGVYGSLGYFFGQTIELIIEDMERHEGLIAAIVAVVAAAFFWRKARDRIKNMKLRRVSSEP